MINLSFKLRYVYLVEMVDTIDLKSISLVEYKFKSCNKQIIRFIIQLVRMCCS